MENWIARAKALHPAIWLVALVVVGVIIWMAQDALRPTVKVVEPRRGSAAEVVYATGTIEPTYWAKVVALQRKRITEICRCEGHSVAKGDILARLDDLEERAGLRELQARLARLREDETRLKKLIARNVTSRVTYDEKRTRIREYEARVAAQIDRINDLQLRAPMDGVVLRRDGEVGEVAGIGPGDVLFWIGKLHPLRVVAEVNEEDIPRIRKGQSVLLRHDGLPDRKLTATVADITPKGDPEKKTFRAYFRLPNDTPLQIGMSVEANVVVNNVKGALLLPAEALMNGGVLVVEAGRIKKRKIQIGIKGTRLVEIRNGIKMGDKVVSPARQDLAIGTRVKMQTATDK